MRSTGCTGCYLEEVCIKNCNKCPDRFFCFTLGYKEGAWEYEFTHIWHKRFNSKMYDAYDKIVNASEAHLAVQWFCKPQIAGSNPVAGSDEIKSA